MNPKNSFLIIIGSIVLTILLLAPSITLRKCPLGLVEDLSPGRCAFYADSNKNKSCDLSQVDSSFPSLGTGTDFPILKHIFKPEVGITLGLLLLASVLLFVGRYLYLRYFTLALGLVYLGFMEGSRICPILSLQILFLLKSKIVLNLSVFVIFLLPIIFALLLGRIFCGYTCPFGAFQDFIYKGFELLRRFLRKDSIAYATDSKQEVLVKSNSHNSGQTLPFGREIESRPVGKRYNSFIQYLSYIKYLILIAVVLSVIFFKRSILCGIDPFGALFCGFITPVSYIVMSALIVTGLFISRPWCRYLCPYGAILGLLSCFSVFRLRVDRKVCIGCDTCRTRCGYHAIGNKKVSLTECIQCGECMSACKNRAITHALEE